MKQLFSLLIVAALVSCTISCATSKAHESFKQSTDSIAIKTTAISTTQQIDSILHHFVLNIDSLVFAFPETLSENFVKDTSPNYPSHPKARTAQPKARSANQPKALKMYGLHIEQQSNKKSVQQSSAVESSNTSQHTTNQTEDKVKKSSPPSPKYIFYILLLLFIAYLIHRFRQH